MTFAFGTVDMVLEPVEEEEQAIDDAKCSREMDRAKTVYEVSKMRTEALAGKASEDMAELQGLLAKLSSGTATRNEKDKLRSLHSKLDGMKKEIEETKHEESTAELEFLRTTTAAKTCSLKAAMKKKEIRSVVRSVCAAESVDLAFVVDCTGSMGSYINAVKNSIVEVVDNVTKTNGNLRLRLAMVGYRDIGDANRFEVLNFTKEVATFKAFLSSLVATGGADAPEDIAGAMQKTKELDWQQGTRVLFLIADAPCHGTEFHSFEDSYPSGTPGIDVVEEFKGVQALCGSGSMNLNFGRITSYTDQMTNVLHDKYGIDLTVVDIRDTGKVAGTVTKTVRKSIFKTMTFAAGGTKSVAFGPLSELPGGDGMSSDSFFRSAVSLKAYKITPSKPTISEWKLQPAIPVKVFRNRRIKSFSDIQAPIEIGMIKFPHAKTDKTNKSTMYMRRSNEPFAEGEIRIAYHAQLSRNLAELDDAKSTMVMKSYKHVGKGLNNRTQYFKQMEVSTIASFLTSEYNKSGSRPARCATIHVLDVLCVEEEDEKNEILGNRRFCAEELLPSGGSTEFIKFNNNTGHWDEDHLDESLLRFSEYTHKMTHGYLMVTDLQGVKKGNSFILTDPVILCKDILRFGNTNLGEKFIAKCIDATRAFMKEKEYV